MLLKKQKWILLTSNSLNIEASPLMLSLESLLVRSNPLAQGPAAPLPPSARPACPLLDSSMQAAPKPRRAVPVISEPQGPWNGTLEGVDVALLEIVKPL